MQPSNRYKLIALDSDVNTLRAIADAAEALFDTIRVRDVQTAMTFCDEDPLVRVIVAEHMIHPQTGLSVLDVIRTRQPHIRRIMLTTYTDLSVIVAGLHTGAIQFLAHKPIQRGELLAAIGQPPSMGVVTPSGTGTRLSA